MWLIVFWVMGSEEAQRESVQINSASIKWFGKERQLRHPHVSTYGYWRVTGLLCLHISEKNETNGSSKHTNKAGGTDQDLRKSFGKLSRPNHGFGEVGIDHMCNQTVRETIWMQFANNLDYKSKLRLSWSTMFTHWLYPGNFVESTRWFHFACIAPFPQCRIVVLQVILLVISGLEFCHKIIVFK